MNISSIYKLIRRALLKRKKVVVMALIWPICLFITAGTCMGERKILLDDYKQGLSPKWKKESFQGETQYTVVTDRGQPCIRAHSVNSASGLLYEIRYEVKDYPLLEWSWKIKDILDKGDATVKEGDDYAARVYVVFPSWAFWRTRAVNYIWANKLPQGKAVPNPFTSNAVMIAVQSGRRNAGTWIRERRNVYEDFFRFFGKKPPEAGAIAIMTDSDNTHSQATAWYGPITIQEKP